jgi:hypothetical protein
MKTKEQRRAGKRVPITVRVKCLPPGVPVKRNGHVSQGWEMLAKDINHDGVGLRWSRQWAARNCPHHIEGLADLFPVHERNICLCTSPDKSLHPGQRVQLDGLIYTEKGSVPMRGLIRWVRPGKRGTTYDVGIMITSPYHRAHFRALENYAA